MHNGVPKPSGMPPRLPDAGQAARKPSDIDATVATSFRCGPMRRDASPLCDASRDRACAQYALRRARSPGHVGWTSQSWSTTLGRIPVSQRASTRPQTCQTVDTDPTDPGCPELPACHLAMVPHLSCVPTTAACHWHARRRAQTLGHAPRAPGRRPGNPQVAQSCGAPQPPSTLLWRVPTPTVHASHAK